MGFEDILHNMYALNNTFSDNVSDHFGESVLAGEMADMIHISTELCEIETHIYSKTSEVDTRLDTIQSMVPLC